MIPSTPEADTKTAVSPAPVLILGGHSFITQLGTDPCPAEAEADALVAACLDQGITHFDTTYRPERIALGASLARLGRRSEARLIAWNFFKTFDATATDPGGPEAYREEDLAGLCADLRTEFIDELVIHRVGDAEADEAQENLALRWQREGRVGRLGAWCPGPGFSTWPRRAAYAFVVEPCNLFTSAAPARIAAHHAAGAQVYGCSPFVRGWQLDKLVVAALAAEPGLAVESARAQVADRLLRHAAFTPHLTGLIVSMRRAAWVAINLGSLTRGPLTPSDHAWLDGLLAAAENR